ncbi:copper-binding protein [Streptomyces sp. IBSBF 3136]|uniref:copper-binding protein n=1 Tax=Streptomyces sp. IBSBF 3136 TaxID=2903524 RepID=UPI002FDC5BBC
MAIPAHTTRTALRATAVGFGAALALTACSNGGGGYAHGSGTTTGSGTGRTVSAVKVTVTETEYALKLSRSSFAPGTYTFVADDAGKITHALSVDGPGVRDARTPDIQKGHKAALTVTLEKGTYDVYCPVDGHRQLGMEQHIHVR